MKMTSESQRRTLVVTSRLEVTIMCIFIIIKQYRDQIANIRWIIEKAREFQKNIYFCLFGLGMRNKAGQRLIEFCQENALVIANTLST